MEVVIHDIPPDHIEQYDFCIVFPIIDNKIDDSDNPINISEEAYDIISKIVLIFGKNYIYQYDCIKLNQRFVLIRGSVSKIKALAESDQYELLLDNEISKQVLMSGDPFHNIEPVYIPHDPPSSKLKPFDYIYGRYRNIANLQNIYWRPHGMNHPFRRSIRLEYIYKILKQSERNNGVALDLRLLQYKQIISAYYPIHTIYELSELEKFWLNITSMPWNQPLFHIKEYFGVRIAFNFIYLDHLSDTLLLPTLLGITLQIIIFYYNNYNIQINPIFSLFICLWLTNLSIFWLRREKLTAFCWGMIKYIESITVHNIRPSFLGVIRQSPIDGTMVLSFNPILRFYLIMQTVIIMIILIGFSVSTVIGTYITYNYILGSDIDSYRQWLVSAITGVLVIVLNNIYYYICIWLTDIENHRVDTKYDRSLQVKYVILQVFNSYFSIYYLAFLSRFPRYIPHHNNIALAIRNSQRNSTMRVLAVNLITIYGLRLFFNLLYMLILYVITKKRTIRKLIKSDRLDNDEVDYWNIYPQKSQELYDKDDFNRNKDPVDDSEVLTYSSYNIKSKSKDDSDVMYTNPSIEANKKRPKQVERFVDSDESENDLTYDNYNQKKKSKDRIVIANPKLTKQKSVERSIAKQRSDHVDKSVVDDDDDGYGMTSIAMDDDSVGNNQSINTSNTPSRSNRRIQMNRSVVASKRTLTRNPSKRIVRRVNQSSETSSRFDRFNLFKRYRTMRSRRNDYNDSTNNQSSINLNESVRSLARSFSQIISRNPPAAFGKTNESNQSMNKSVYRMKSDNNLNNTSMNDLSNVSIENDFTAKVYQVNLEETFFYTDIIISYGYILVFGCLVPGIAGLGIIDIIIIYRINAFKLIHYFQRPILLPTQTIGVWNNVFDFILSIAIITNSGLIVFTMTIFDFLSISSRLWLFFGFISYLFLFKYILSIWLAIESKAVKLQKYRTEFLTSKLIEKIPDAEFDPTSLL